jgi:hypothetical protein
MFCEKEMKGFIKTAQELNQKEEGDQACFYLIKG